MGRPEVSPLRGFGLGRAGVSPLRGLGLGRPEVLPLRGLGWGRAGVSPLRGFGWGRAGVSPLRGLGLGRPEVSPRCGWDGREPARRICKVGAGRGMFEFRLALVGSGDIRLSSCLGWELAMVDLLLQDWSLGWSGSVTPDSRRPSLAEAKLISPPRKRWERERQKSEPLQGRHPPS